MNLTAATAFARQFGPVGGYLFATLTASAAGFLSVPLLIRLLGQAEFGRWSLLEPTFLVLSQVALLGTNHGIIKQVNHDRLPFRACLRRLLTAGQVSLAFFSFLAYCIARSSGFSTWEAAALGVVTYLEGGTLLVLSAYRAASLAGRFSVTQITRAALFLGCLLIASFGIGHVSRARDVLLIRVVAVGSAFAVGLASLARPSPASAPLPAPGSYEGVPSPYLDAVRYGFPMLLTSLLALVIEYADRYILKSFFDYETLASYVIFMKVGSILSLAAITPFALWWPTERFKRLKDPDGGSSYFRIASLVFLAVLLTGGGVLWLSTPWFLPWFAPTVTNKPVVCLTLILSVVVTGMTYPLNIGLLSEGKTHWNVYAVLIGAACHLAACFTTIPTFGAVGAAGSTLLSYSIYAVFVNYLSQQIHPVEFAYKAMFLISAFATALMIAIYASIAGNSFAACVGRVLLYLIGMAPLYRILSTMRRRSSCAFASIT